MHYIYKILPEQLNKEKEAKRAFYSFKEGQITFPPTFKVRGWFFLCDVMLDTLISFLLLEILLIDEKGARRHL